MYSNEFDQIVNSRRSNRRFDENVHVPEEVITRSLERAIKAPNSSNMQLWEFYWIKSDELKQKMHPLCLNQSAAKTAKYLIVFVVRKDLWSIRAKWNLEKIKHGIGNQTPNKMQKRALQYYGKLMPLIYRNDPFGINTLIRMIISHGTGLFKPFMRMNGKADQRVMGHKSCALAAQTFMLSISAEGYDTCPMEGTDTTRVRKLLNLPYGAEINMVVAVGKGTKDGIYNERLRLPYEEVVFGV
jgi:nitroreductase